MRIILCVVSINSITVYASGQVEQGAHGTEASMGWVIWYLAHFMHKIGPNTFH